MSNETDLDWLARNVTKKQLSAGGFIKKDARGGNGILHITETPKSLGWYFLSEVSDRRAELQNKPSWKDAPEWAINLVQIASGSWVWIDSVLFGSGDKFEYSGHYGAVLGDWRDTLERRPKDLSEPAVTDRLTKATDNVLAAVPQLKSDRFKFDPLTSIEDNQEQDMAQQAEKQQDNSWFERGELPPVGAECEINHKSWASNIRHKVKVLAITDEYLIVKYQFFELHYLLKDMSFRPILTERDVLIDAIASQGLMGEYGDLSARIADAVIAAGFRLGAP